MSCRDVHIEVASDPKLLCCVRALTRTYLNVLGLLPDRAEDVVLALDEACANAIRHSYEGRTDEKLELDFTHDGEYTEIVLRDGGVPASRERLAARLDEDRSPDAIRPGGLGVQIMYRVFDEVMFKPGETVGNTVVMRLRTSPRGSAG